MKNVDFSDWLNKKFVEYRGDTRRTISDFAAHIGVRQPVMSNWMKKGGNTPKNKNLLRIAEKLGPEVYDVLDLPRPAFDPFDPMPPAMREALEDAVHELKEAMSKYNLDPVSPAAEALSIEIMERHGFKWIETRDEQPG